MEGADDSTVLRRKPKMANKPQPQQFISWAETVVHICIVKSSLSGFSVRGKPGYG